MGAPPLYVSIDSIAGMPQKSEPYRKSRKKMTGIVLVKKGDVVEKTVSYSLAAKGIEGVQLVIHIKQKFQKQLNLKAQTYPQCQGP